MYLLLYATFQIEWLNKYNQKIRDEVGHLLRDNKDAFDWMQRRTEKIFMPTGASAAPLSQSFRTLTILMMVICFISQK